VSQRPCPQCGAPLAEQARFCGQCGTTVLPPTPAHEPLVHEPNVHEEVTIAREIPAPDLAALQRSVVGTSSKPTLAQTLADPEAEARAREIRDVALGSAPTAEAAPKPALMKTMLLGGEGSAPPHEGGGVAPSKSDRPTAPPQTTPDASPLSRSVLAPEPWLPPRVDPPPGSVQPAPVLAVGEPAPEPARNPLTSTAAMPPAQAPPAPQASPPLRTMLGMPARDLPAPAPNAAPVAPSSAPQAAAMPPAQKTMMGVAIPGIAPLQPSAPVDPRNLQSRQGTMMGVAVPGIAPTHGPSDPQPPRIPSQVQNTALGIAAPYLAPVVPPPPPLADEPLPPPPQLPQQKGVPALALVGGLIALVLLVGGVGAFFALRSGGPLTAAPQLDETGRESLKLGCPTCPDGTVVTLGASSATVAASAAVLPLPAPLKIGDNDLVVKIDRPASGRDEDVKIHVPVAYRVRADLTTLAARPPAITVRVEATPGSEATVDGKPVPLDATGRGSYALDLSSEVEGPGEAKTFEKKIPFAITPKGAAQETGQLTARTAIVPLALDAPGRELVTDKTTAAVAGQTRPGTVVTVGGQPASVDAQGRFGVRVELPPSGEKILDIMAASPPLAPRIVKARVVRVGSLGEGAKLLDAESPATFEVFGADPASKAGTKAVLEGEVLDARVSAGHTILLVDDRSGCAKGASCLVRVEHGDEDKVARGDVVRVYGRVNGAVSASGKTVPDVGASLVLVVRKAGSTK